MMNEYSARLGFIAPDQFQAALDRFDLGTFVRAEPISAGLFGQNVFITSTTGEYVLRGSPHYLWQFPAEQFFARLLHQAGCIPVPWPYLLDPTEEIFGWSYVLMPRMPGLQLSDPQVKAGLGPDERRAIARALGERLAQAQRVTWPIAGRYDLSAGTIVAFPGGCGTWVQTTIHQLLTKSRHYNDRTTEADQLWSERLLAEAAEALTVPHTPCFVMTDFKEQNLTVEQHDDGWRVSGLFDLMESVFADGEMDLCRQSALYLEQDEILARAFVQAYLGHKLPRPGFAQRFPVYMLRERLIVWEYFQRPNHELFWPTRLTLREWLEPYLTSLPRLW